LTISLRTLSFVLTPCSLSSCLGSIKVLFAYLFLISPKPNGIPNSCAYPIAAGVPESGTEKTKSAFTGASFAKFLPALNLA
jgi:hypothetical protein